MWIIKVRLPGGYVPFIMVTIDYKYFHINIEAMGFYALISWQRMHHAQVFSGIHCARHDHVTLFLIYFASSIGSAPCMKLSRYTLLSACEPKRYFSCKQYVCTLPKYHQICLVQGIIIFLICRQHFNTISMNEESCRYYLFDIRLYDVLWLK